MICVKPDLHIIYTFIESEKDFESIIRFTVTKKGVIITLANNLDTMQPRLRILHCFEYGKYGMTPTIERADDVLQAYAMINSSIMLLLTSLCEKELLRRSHHGNRQFVV